MTINHLELFMFRKLILCLTTVISLAACSSNVTQNAESVEQKSPESRTKITLTNNDARKSPGTLLATRSVYFDYNQDTLKPEYQNILQAHAKFLAEHPKLEMKLEGNTDERGGAEYNLALGQRRAENVNRTMVLLGAPLPQIEVVSWGKEKPKSSGHDESAWSMNRRVDITYSDEQ